MSRRLGIGVLGVGTIATVRGGVLPNLGQLADKVEVVGLADLDHDRAVAIADQFGVPTVYDDLSAMLADPAIEAVVNLTPIPVHGATCIQILRAGKHLATEKPLATSMSDADEICRLAVENKLTVVNAPFNMVFPDRQAARSLIRADTIGKVAFARVRSSNRGPAAGNWPLDPTWFYQQGSGPLFDMGVYGIHEITGILGPAQRVSAVAGITEPVRVVAGGPFQGKEIEVTADDNVLVTLDFGGATFATIDATFNVTASRGPKIEIYGRKGTLNVNGAPIGNPGPDLEYFRAGDDDWTVPDLSARAAESERLFGLYRAVLVDQLADEVLGGAPSLLNSDHARHILEITLKAQESASTCRPIDLDTTFTLPL
jgi:predicted dehydrogenase